MGKGMTPRDVTLATPSWAAEPISGHLVAGGVKLDASAFPITGNWQVVLTANAAAAAVSLTVEALEHELKAGTLLYFGEAGEFARVTATAAQGATSVAVEALVNAVESGDKAPVPASGPKTVKGGTVVGRTYAEMAAGNAFGPAGDTDDEFFIVAFDIYDLDEDNDATLLRGNVVVFENYLPGYSSLSATVLAAVRDKYICKQGTD